MYKIYINIFINRLPCMYEKLRTEDLDRMHLTNCIKYPQHDASCDVKYYWKYQFSVKIYNNEQYTTDIYL